MFGANTGAAAACCYYGSDGGGRRTRTGAATMLPERKKRELEFAMIDPAQPFIDADNAEGGGGLSGHQRYITGGNQVERYNARRFGYEDSSGSLSGEPGGGYFAFGPGHRVERRGHGGFAMLPPHRAEISGHGGFAMLPPNRSELLGHGGFAGIFDFGGGSFTNTSGPIPGQENWPTFPGPEGGSGNSGNSSWDWGEIFSAAPAIISAVRGRPYYNPAQIQQGQQQTYSTSYPGGAAPGANIGAQTGAAVGSLGDAFASIVYQHPFVVMGVAAAAFFWLMPSPRRRNPSRRRNPRRRRR